MVKLFCALVGVKGSAFSVTIDASESVDDLKKAIKKENEKGITCDARELQLFLARKGDLWLPDDDPAVLELEEGKVHKDIQTLIDGEKMKETWTIEEVLKANNMTRRRAPKSKQLHVLVVVPKQEGSNTTSEMSAAGLRSVEALGEMVEARFNKVLKERDEKTSAYSFSELNTEMEQRIVKKMRLTENIPVDINEPEDTSIPGFSWIPKVPENEQSQRSGYMAYLQQHLATLMKGGNFVLADIANDKSVLDVVDSRLPFRMSGSADVLLIKGRRMNPLIPLAGVCMVIELKKKVEKGHVPQAVGQLVSSSIKAPLNCYPLSLLTDLNDCWHFSWFSDKHVLTHVTLQYPKNAFNFIEAAALNRTESPPRPPPFIPGPFKTMKVDDFLTQPVDAGAEEMMERYELMADVVEPEFLMERRMEYGQHLVQSMPMYAHMYA